MRKVQLPYLEYIKSKGREYIYYRQKGARIRMPSDPDSFEFQQRYWDLRRGNTEKSYATTWENLIQDYYKSPKYLGLSLNTRANYRRHCERIREENGDLNIKHFKRTDALRVQAALQDNWSKANETIAVLSILCKHAVDLDWIKTNPVTNIKKLKGDSYEAWPDAKLREYEEYCDANNLTLERTLYELAIGTGQRLGDCLAMKWEHFDGEYMSVTQIKTGKRLTVACPRRLRDYLSKLPKNGNHILAKNSTEGFLNSPIQKRIGRIREAIGVKEGKDRLVIHGWRYTAAKQLADAGCSLFEIQSVTGHLSVTMVAKYTDQRDAKLNSKAAQDKRGTY